MLWHEPGAADLRARMFQATVREMSSCSYVEISMVLMGRGKQAPDRAVDLLRRFIDEVDIVLTPFDAEQARDAAAAALRFGKSRHRAKLNLGDCFSYALSKARKAPLLYVGEDFGRTDVEAALA